MIILALFTHSKNLQNHRRPDNKYITFYILKCAYGTSDGLMWGQRIRSPDDSILWHHNFFCMLSTLTSNSYNCLMVKMKKKIWFFFSFWRSEMDEKEINRSVIFPIYICSWCSHLHNGYYWTVYMANGQKIYIMKSPYSLVGNSTIIIVQLFNMLRLDGKTNKSYV